LKREHLYREVLALFREHNPEAATELRYGSPYELLVAVILSAQCTDVRVNMITPAFFESFPDPYTLAAASHEAVFEKIKSCSYPNNKTKSLIGMARVLTEEFGGVVPGDVDALQRLPGVGRKTANVIASVVFDLPAMAVDTHVFRVADRIGLTENARNPLESEKQLVKYIPQEDISRAHHWLILHGRYICKARKPVCSSCFLTHLCKFYHKQKSFDQIVDKK
jgi:endonuclease III